MNLVQCTFSQIRQKKKDYLQQFNSTTIEYAPQSQTLQFNSNEYKRLTDALIAKNDKNKQKLSNIYKRKTFQSTSKIIQSKSTNFNCDSDEEYEDGFYITQNINKQKRASQESMTSSQCRSKKLNTKQNNALSFVNETQQSKKLQEISDKICAQKSIYQTLSHQKVQTENAINHFKKRIIEYQNYLNTQMLKQKEALKVKMENKQELFKTVTTNNQIKKAYIKTVGYFNKDFEGKVNVKDEIQKKNQQTFQQAAKRDIIYHKMRQKVSIQKQELQVLEKYEGKMLIKKKKVDILIKRHQQFLQIAKAIFDIQKNQQRKQRIQSIETNFQNFNHQKKRTIKKLDSFQRKDLIEITSQIIDYFQRLKQSEKMLIQQFKFFIDEKRSKTITLTDLQTKLTDVILFLSSPSLISKYQQIRNESLLRISKIQQKLKMLSMCANAFEDRLKFYLSKQFANLHRIIELWLKNDKQANLFISQFENKLKDVFSLTKQEVCQKQSKDLLEEFFYNGEKYKFYLEIINQNPFIFRYLNKNSLFNHFKRIVKTKIKNPNLCTIKIFQKSLEQIYNQSLLFFQVKSQQLLQMSKNIYKFLNQTQNIQTNFHHFSSNNDSQDPSQFPSRNQLVKQEKQNEEYSDYVSFTIQDLKDFNRKSHLQHNTIIKQRLNPNTFFQKMKMGIQMVKIPLNQVKSFS